MLESLRSIAISLAVASFLASGIRGFVAPAFAAESAGSASAANIPVRYETSGDKLTGVELSLSASAPKQVKVRLSADGTWYRCVSEGGTAHCTIPGVTVSAIDDVQVSAVS